MSLIWLALSGDLNSTSKLFVYLLKVDIYYLDTFLSASTSRGIWNMQLVWAD